MPSVNLVIFGPIDEDDLPEYDRQGCLALQAERDAVNRTITADDGNIVLRYEVG